ncbi:hypothetical protein K7640_19210 [Micromonospora sp. PLK6-60]|uniref:hypothetical protein n=1 Tax=Micromonospora sp. PLK6-60 TaxID=2873383 RepID=UPI001CA63E58|nr:hypothetical protein [Micromonospora sp. PLK6-60]MBY8873962.1 hypothetical protein [Micromonospora sp. PLK6-60]
MTEYEDRLVDAEFTAYRDALVPAVQPAGPDAARATVRRRRHRAVAVTAAAVVLAVAVPVAGRAALDRESGPPDPGPAQSVEPSPTGTGAPSPSAAPSTSPPVSPPAGSPTGSAGAEVPTVPDGRISRAQLLAGKVDLPAWTPEECAAGGGVRLRKTDQDVGVPALLSLAHGDIDADGADETVALLGCRYGEAVGKQVVAFDRDTAGRIVTLGQVTRTGEGQRDILAYEVTDGGSVRVRVADIQPCCDVPTYLARDQWRTYRWQGGRFAQTGGPTEFGPDDRLTDLALTAGELVLSTPGADGKRTGSLTVTVVNKGPVDVPLLGFVGLDRLGERAGGDFAQCRDLPEVGPHWASCVTGGLPAGQRRSLTFTVLVDGSTSGDPAVVRVVHYDAQNKGWPDLVETNNGADVRSAG